MAKSKKTRPSWDLKRVRALRKHLGKTQQEFADDLGVRQQTVSEWETGLYAPRGASVTLLRRVAEEADFSYKAEGKAGGKAEGHENS